MSHFRSYTGDGKAPVPVVQAGANNNFHLTCDDPEVFWRLVEHPRTALIAGLILGGAGIAAPFLAPGVWVAALWLVAAVLILRSAFTWPPLRDRVPVEFRSPIVRKGGRPAKPPTVPAPRGMWDYRRDGDRAMNAMTAILINMAAEMNRSRKRVVANTRRMEARAKQKPSVEKSYALASQTGADINRHAKAMEGLEAKYRKARIVMTENFSAWFKGQPAGTDLSVWAKSLQDMAQVSKDSGASTDGYRQSVADLRNQNISQPINQATDRLCAVLSDVIQDIESTRKFCLDNLEVLTNKGVKRESAPATPPATG